MSQKKKRKKSNTGAIAAGLAVGTLAPIGADYIRGLAVENIFKRPVSKKSIAIGVLQGLGGLGLGVMGVGGTVRAAQEIMEANKHRMTKQEKAMMNIAQKMV